MKKLICLILITLQLPIFACINETAVMPDGIEKPSMPWDMAEIKPSMTKDSIKLREESYELEAQFNKDGDIDAFSDFGAKLIYLGDLKEAKKVYFEIEKLKPNRYATASNLGTIYELTGQNDSALYWIKKSIELNPNSHAGSEWIHVKILEFKINGNTNIPNSILGLNLGKDSIPKQIKNYATIKHLRHQIRERLNFISPPNKIMGNLFFDYANLLSHQAGVEQAIDFYHKAKEFGYQSEIMDNRIYYFNLLLRKHNSKQAINAKGEILDTMATPLLTEGVNDYESIKNDSVAPTLQKVDSHIKSRKPTVEKNEITKTLDPTEGNYTIFIVGGIVLLLIGFLVIRKLRS